LTEEATAMASNQLSKTLAVLQGGIEQGLHLGAQLYVSVRGEVVADVAVGLAHGSPAGGTPMTPDSINLWMSSVKPAAAVAIAQLWERGRLQVDDPVARHIPEFAQNGKERITIRHLLTHTGGFRAMPDEWLSESWDQIIARICAMRPEPRWVPGEKAGYHPRTGWFILGEIVRRIDGRPYDHYARDEIFVPLGMNDSWAGMPRDKYREYLESDRLAAMYEIGEASPDPHDASAGMPTEDQCAAVRPASNGRGPIRGLGRFYEMLLQRGELHDQRILKPESVAELIKPHRVGMFDHTFKAQMDWGLGFILNTTAPAEIPYGYGPRASRQTFGHSGAQSSCAFCDQEHQLVVAWICNGMPGEARHQARQRDINSAIYLDLAI
jgi:CubicO group peptidase (beta-lactamase class C family)